MDINLENVNNGRIFKASQNSMQIHVKTLEGKGRIGRHYGPPIYEETIQFWKGACIVS